jgi:hypothetical protein
MVENLKVQPASFPSFEKMAHVPQDRMIELPVRKQQSDPFPKGGVFNSGAPPFSTYMCEDDRGLGRGKADLQAVSGKALDENPEENIVGDAVNSRC